jgi:hypothetical protein
MGRTNEAINETDRVLAASPENLLAQLARLELLAESHWWREVATVSPQALQISPDHPRVIRLYGTALNLTGFRCWAPRASRSVAAQSPTTSIISAKTNFVVLVA